MGYMAAFVEERPRTPAAMSYIRNTTIGGDTPYVYVTRRTYDRPDGTVTLTCMGGPEHPIEAAYDRGAASREPCSRRWTTPSGRSRSRRARRAFRTTSSGTG